MFLKTTALIFISEWPRDLGSICCHLLGTVLLETLQKGGCPAHQGWLCNTSVSNIFSIPVLIKLFLFISNICKFRNPSTRYTMNPRPHVNTHCEVMFLLTSLILWLPLWVAHHVSNSWDCHKKERTALLLQLGKFYTAGVQGLTYFPDAAGCSCCHAIHHTPLLIALSHPVCSHIFEIAF